MESLLGRIARAWRVLMERDELETRTLSFGCAALEILEQTSHWDIETVRWIATEAVQRKLAAVDEYGQLTITVDGALVKTRSPRSEL